MYVLSVLIWKEKGKGINIHFNPEIQANADICYVLILTDLSNSFMEKAAKFISTMCSGTC